MSAENDGKTHSEGCWKWHHDCAVMHLTAAKETIRDLQSSLAEKDETIAELRERSLSLSSALNAAAGWMSGYCPKEAAHVIARIDAAIAAQHAQRKKEGKLWLRKFQARYASLLCERLASNSKLR